MLFSWKEDGQIRGGPTPIVFCKGGQSSEEATSGLIKAKPTTVISEQYFTIYLYVILTTLNRIDPILYV